MNSRIEEGSSAITETKNWPSKISEQELSALKVAIAAHEEFPVDSDNAFKRDSEEWIGMEEALGQCMFAVFHHYKPEAWEKEGTAFFLLSPFVEGQYQVWVAEENNLRKIRKIDQATEVRDDY